MYRPVDELLMNHDTGTKKSDRTQMTLILKHSRKMVTGILRAERYELPLGSILFLESLLCWPSPDSSSSIWKDILSKASSISRS